MSELTEKKIENRKLSYLSKEYFDCLKGYFALFVLIHHLYQFTGLFSTTRLAIVFTNLGYLSVAAFIFFSGYGLYESFLKKGDEYLKKFPLKRILSFYFTYCIVAIFYIVFDMCLGVTHELSDYIKTFTYGSTIISFGWYLQLNLLLYIIFYLIFKFVKISKLRSLIFLLVVIIYSVFYYVNGLPVGLYIPMYFFLFGIICSRYKDKLEIILCKFNILILILGAIICAIGLLIVWRYGYLIPRIAEPIIYIVSILSFLLFMLAFIRLCSNFAKGIIINPISNFLGKISFEIYVLQGFVLRSLILFDLNVYLYILIAIITCILIAIPINKLFVFIQKKIFSK